MPPQVCVSCGFWIHLFLVLWTEVAALCPIWRTCKIKNVEVKQCMAVWIKTIVSAHQKVTETLNSNSSSRLDAYNCNDSHS